MVVFTGLQKNDQVYIIKNDLLKNETFFGTIFWKMSIFRNDLSRGKQIMIEKQLI